MKTYVKAYLILIAVMIFSSLSVVEAQTYKADPDKTVIIWKGKKIAGEHTGTIQLKSGTLEIKDNKPVSGTVIIDMKSLKDTDISNDGMREKLEEHLRSDDFFSVEKYPEARLELTGTERTNGGPVVVQGNITIKGITEPIEFITNMNEYGEDLVFTGHIDIDRTLFDVRYGSKKFFDNIGDAAINDIFNIDYELHMLKVK
ncbi:MAG: YceI family protein [Bacteroidales bacterium]|nr:YceI family protein [Bacteroidales bacterium]